MSQMLSLFSEGKVAPKMTPHQQLRKAGWKKSNGVSKFHDGSVYTHPEHRGHEIHLRSSGEFEHVVSHNTNNLAKHLDAHEREHIYSGDRAVAQAHSNRMKYGN